MDVINGQIKDLVAGADSTDAATMAQTPKVYRAGVLKTNVKMYTHTATVSSGNVSFWLTSDGTSSGTALFSNVYKESLNWWIDDASNQYQLGGYSLAGDMKSITLTVNRLGTVLIGIIQFITGANGVTVHLNIWGD